MAHATRKQTSLHGKQWSKYFCSQVLRAWRLWRQRRPRVQGYLPGEPRLRSEFVSQEGKTITFHTSAVARQLYLDEPNTVVDYILYCYILYPRTFAAIQQRCTDTNDEFQNLFSVLHLLRGTGVVPGLCQLWGLLPRDMRWPRGLLLWQQRLRRWNSYFVRYHCKLFDWKKYDICLQKHFSCCFVKCEASFQSENGQFRALLLWKMILAIVKTTTARRETCFYRQIKHIFLHNELSRSFQPVFFL